MKNFLILSMILGAGAYFGSKWYLHDKVEHGMDMAILMMAPYADVEYGGVDSTLTGELTVEDIRVRIDGFNDDIFIERLGIDTPSFLSLISLGDVLRMRSDKVPEYFGFIMEGLRIRSNADYFRKLYVSMHDASGVDDAGSAAAECTGKYGFSPQVLMDLGYEEQVTSASVFVRNQRGRYSLDMQLSMQDMWDIEASLVLAGDMLTEMSRGRAYRPRLQSMTLQMTDHSLNQRISDYCARRGLTPDETLQAQLESFKLVGQQNGIEFDEYVLDPYLEFIGGKSTIVITARPNEPLAFSHIDMYKPSDVPALLNLEATAL